MNISLTPELESRVRAKVEGGLYNNASEVIREALRFVDIHEQWINELKLQQLRTQLKVGREQLQHGEGTLIESDAELDTFFQNITE